MRQNAEYILENSKIIDPTQCLIYKSELYERLSDSGLRWGHVTSVSDAQHVTDPNLLRDIENLWQANKVCYERFYKRCA